MLRYEGLIRHGGLSLKTIATHEENVYAARANRVKRKRERAGAKAREKRALGNTEVKKHPQVDRGFYTSDAEAKLAYSRKLWGLQGTLWDVTQSKRLAGCHRWRAPGSAVARLDWASEKGARFGGLQDSHSVWASPISAARIGKVRAGEIRRALRAWIQDSKDKNAHDIAFLTLTLRHSKEDSLKSVWDTLSKCWAGVTQTAAWRGSKKVAGDMAKFGLVHFIKAVEVTHGKNGWHVHAHVLLLTQKTLSEQQKQELESRIYSRWSAAAERRGFKAPSRERGVKLERAAQANDYDALAEYMAKSQLSGINGLADEVTGSVVKRAKGENRSPFQVLESLGEKKTPSDLAIWYEWEKNSHGRRQISWSKGAKRILGVDELSDEEISDGLDEEFAKTAYTVATIPAGQWAKIQSDIELRLAVVEEVSRASTASHARVRATRILKKLDVEHTSFIVEIYGQKEVENRKSPPN